MSDLTPEQFSIINYLNFKMECLRDQESVGVVLDYPKAVMHRDELLRQKEEKISQLIPAMPKKILYKDKSKPKVTHKKDGTLSKLGEEWFAFLKEYKLKATEKGPIRYPVGKEDGNPGSPEQVKDWLFSLGWEPCTYKQTKSKATGEVKEVPQVRNLKGHEREGELCDSVLRLVTQEPAIEILEGITIIQHRLGVFQSFIDSAVQKNCQRCDGTGKYPKGTTTTCQLCHGSRSQYVMAASAGGFTNTLRFKHRKPIANLPKVGVPWGEEIRSCIISPFGNSLCGSDMVSLESTTKRHYMYPHDPDYVTEMSKEGFDEHLDLATFAGKVTQEEVELHNKGEINLKPIRSLYKGANYSAIYGVGAPKLARSLGITVKEAGELLEAYWARNWSVKEISKGQYVKTLKDGSMWLQNPVSGYYHSLRYEKDIFSTLNQSTGVYCFDTWLAYCKKDGINISLQYHDEQLSLSENNTETEKKLRSAIDKTNKRLKLNVLLDIDVQFGDNYAEVH